MNKVRAPGRVPGSGAGMCFLIDLLESFDAGVRIDLSGRHRGVAQQLLHGPQVRPGVEQMRGERVTQRVHAQSALAVDLVEELAYGVLNGGDADPASSLRKEYGVSVAPTALAHQIISLGFVVPKGEHGVIPDGNNALLATLAAHFDLLADEIQVRPIQPL